MAERGTITPAEIESCQDEVLGQLDELNRQIEQALRDAGRPHPLVAAAPPAPPLAA